MKNWMKLAKINHLEAHNFQRTKKNYLRAFSNLEQSCQLEETHLNRTPGII